MKGVRFPGRGQGKKSANESRHGIHIWRVAASLVVALLLSPLLMTSGVGLASPEASGLSFREDRESAVEITIGTMKVTMFSNANAHHFTFKQNGAEFSVVVVDDSEGVRYSFNGRSWQEVRLESLLGRQSSVLSLIDQQSSPMQDPDFHRGGTKYWWDGVRFMKGFPTVYPHPDRSFYHLLPKSDWRYWGVKLMHYQLGTDHVGALTSAGPYAVGAVIGGVIGFTVGGAVGAAIGAIAGVLVGAILAYYFSVTFVDEAGAIWWWINKSLFNALRSIPWWLWFCGRCVEAYIASHIDYLRVGTLTANNDLRISGP